MQRIATALHVKYDPGEEEDTPENVAKRTFWYDDFIGRPTSDPYEPLLHDEINEYVAAKSSVPQDSRKFATKIVTFARVCQEICVNSLRSV